MDFKKLKQEVEIEFNQAKQTVVNAEKVIETGKMRMSELQGQWQLLEKMEKGEDLLKPKSNLVGPNSPLKDQKNNTPQQAKAK